MGCASSKHQMMRNAVAKMSSDHQTNATCTDSERTYTERTYCDKENRSAMMTTATGEVTKIETVKPPGRLSTVRRSSRSKSNKVGPTPTTTTSYETGGSSRSKKSTAACGGGESSGSSKHRRESPPIQIRRVSKIDRTAKTHPGSLELDNNSAHSSRSTSEHSAVMFKANCDRQSLAAALDHFDLEDFSNHTSSSHYHEDPLICIVRSDKLAFSGAGIRRHSRRKRHRQLGKDNTKIVILRQPSFKEQAAMAAAEAAAEAVTKANKDLEDECAKQRSDRRLTRRAAANARKPTTDRACVGDRCRTTRGSTTATTKRNSNNNNKVVEQQQLSPNGTPVRSNSVLRGGSSSGVMMFEDKSSEADLDYWPLPLHTAVQ